MAKANREGENAPVPAGGPIVQSKLMVQPCGPLVAWIRSEFPVKSLKDSTRIYIERLSAALSDGVAAQRDSSRRDCFEIVLGHIWMYLHICEHLQSVYIVAAANPDFPGHRGNPQRATSR